MSSICFYIGFTEKKKFNHAVFNATKLHINMLSSQGVKFVIITPSKLYYNELISEFSNDQVFYSSNRKTLESLLTKYNVSTIWSPDILSTIFLKILFIFRKIRIATWFQGALPEESLLRNNSKINYYILSTLEYLGLIITDIHIFVSDSMLNHYKNKYSLNINESKTLIIPCISDLKYSGGDKIKNSFCYIGGISKWQCFDEIVSLFYTHFSHLENSKLFIVTRDQSLALKTLDKYYNIQYELVTLNDRNEIAHFLSKMEYGFLIRENIILNNVASPIKFAEYLSCGVKIIMNESIPHFSEIIKIKNIGYIYSNSEIKNYTENSHPMLIVALYQEFFSFESVSTYYTSKLLSASSS
jgi:hypothetical protein